ncbi:hypothetical protein DPMN_077278 [Dreissena polymorpha]|uniref:Uncharacterized protein n=1 Tax=Dreissena polymorpha TaxID=45954 RepID=A0A9D3YKN1_DREPO|nr:hypothetical protein DPMN_077278 [Dreissena polymorpha]
MFTDIPYDAEDIDYLKSYYLDELMTEAENEEGFRNQALECFEALNKKIDGLETKAEMEDEFRRLLLAQLNKMQESIDNLHRKKADSEHEADEKTKL